MGSGINLDRVRLSEDQLVPVKGKVNTGVRRRMTVRFLKGPVPLGWLRLPACLEKLFTWPSSSDFSRG